MSRPALSIRHDWEEPEDLHQLLQLIRERRDDADIPRIRYAYFLAEQAHAGQTRTSGEAYIHHPLAVAKTLVELQMDDDSIIAALLHDVLEDCPEIKAETILADFGEDVLRLVEGVTKLKLQDGDDLTVRQRAAAETARTAETLRKMLLAMASDFRVMVIKLADRLHNMSTLDSLSESKKLRIATETLDVYAPLAARLGIWQIKWQLEDLSFKALHPEEFAKVSELVGNTRRDRERQLEEAIVILKQKFEDRGLKVIDIRGRPKHLYSIFNKMVKGHIPFEEIYDLLALRIIVPEISDCYLALGVVHETYLPMPTLFYDYIGRPKPNGYQSLHTKVVGPNQQPLEVQIRTLQMHQIAEFGVAAHWTYKEGKAANDETKRLAQLREQLFDWSSNSRTSSDFLRTLSTDLFSEQVFVFTPKGDVKDLPKRSTPVDFAFRVHSQLGLTLVGARINGTMSPLSTQLKNGDVVELITRSNATPSLDWLEFVQSAHTKSKLKAYFRRLSKNADAQRGREALDKEFRGLGLDPRLYLGDEKLKAIVEHFDSVESPTDIFARVGSGLLSVQNVVAKLRGTVADVPSADRIEVTKTKEGKVALVSKDVMVNRARCCHPIPGDEVVGYVTRGRGIMIHRKVCPNAMAYLSSEPERLIAYDVWEKGTEVFSVPLKVLAVNRPGLLMDVSTIFGESKTNVSSAKVKTLPNQTAEIEATIDVTDTVHLSHVMTKISQFSDVISILRMFGRSTR